MTVPIKKRGEMGDGRGIEGEGGDGSGIGAVGLRDGGNNRKRARSAQRKLGLRASFP